MHEGFLVYANSKYLKWAVALSVASIAAYIFYEPIDEHNGGTVLGYILGTVGVLLIFLADLVRNKKTAIWRTFQANGMGFCARLPWLKPNCRSNTAYRFSI